MIRRTSAIERMLILSVTFTLALLATRIIYTKEFVYLFYAWNIFLAILPFYFSRQLVKEKRLDYKAVFLLAVWLLFFPNAPYIITDIFHFEKRPPIPPWYDLTMVVSATWNGLLLGILSLMQVEIFMMNHFKKKWVSLFVFVCLSLCGYGVYLGRFLRYNSWDIITKPLLIFYSSAHQILHPLQNLSVWAFTFVFSTMLYIIYVTLKQMPIWMH